MFRFKVYDEQWDPHVEEAERLNTVIIATYPSRSYWGTIEETMLEMKVRQTPNIFGDLCILKKEIQYKKAHKRTNSVSMF